MASLVEDDNFSPAAKKSPEDAPKWLQKDTAHLRTLTPEETESVQKRQATLVSDFKRRKLETEAQKNWERFYQRNRDHFFKDRNWTERDLEELFGFFEPRVDIKSAQTILDAGCGCGNAIFPLAKFFPTWTLCGIDFSPAAIELLRERSAQVGIPVHSDVADLVELGEGKTQRPQNIPAAVNIISAIFVLSAISAEKQLAAIHGIRILLDPVKGGDVILRDYGVNDHAMLRFGRGTKISERFYARQDGTRAYFFFREELIELFEKAGFQCICCRYVYKPTTNVKEGLCVERVFVEARFSFSPS